VGKGGMSVLCGWIRTNGREEGEIWSSCTSSVHLQLHENSKAGSTKRWIIFLKKSQPANLPNTSIEILPSASVAINVKFNIADFFNQFSPLLYLFHPSDHPIIHFVGHMMLVIVNYYYYHYY
jgi:hypothetical protein